MPFCAFWTLPFQGVKVGIFPKWDFCLGNGQFLHIDNFKKNPSVNKIHEMRGKTNFIRKGIVGDYRNHFDEKMVQEWDEWLNEEFKDTDISM